jgi:uncharacterized membrane protein YkgB
MKKWIEEPKYVFDINDIIGIIYIVCVIGIISGLNMTPLFLIGCIISLISCFKARRINLVIINIAFVVLYGYYLIQMIWG